MLAKALKFFGIDCLNSNRFILVKHTNDGDIYYRCSVDGVPDFCLNKAEAWRFRSAEQAAQARKFMGIWYRTMSIYEVIEKDGETIKRKVYAQ